MLDVLALCVECYGLEIWSFNNIAHNELGVLAIARCIFKNIRFSKSFKIAILIEKLHSKMCENECFSILVATYA